MQAWPLLFHQLSSVFFRLQSTDGVYACGANSGQLGSVIQSDQDKLITTPRKVYASHSDVVAVRASERMTAILTRQRHILLLAHNATRTVRGSALAKPPPALCFVSHVLRCSPCFCVSHWSDLFPVCPARVPALVLRQQYAGDRGRPCGLCCALFGEIWTAYCGGAQRDRVVVPRARVPAPALEDAAPH